MSCVDLGVVCDKHVGYTGVRIMCYSDAVLWCLLWRFIYKVHNCSSWLQSTTNRYKAGTYSLVYDKMYSSCICPITKNAIHSCTLTKVGRYFTLEYCESLRTSKIVGLNVMIFVFIATIRWVSTD